MLCFVLVTVHSTLPCRMGLSIIYFVDTLVYILLFVNSLFSIALESFMVRNVYGTCLVISLLLFNLQALLASAFDRHLDWFIELFAVYVVYVVYAVNLLVNALPDINSLVVFITSVCQRYCVVYSKMY
jgi:hypothetical protein